MVREIYRDEEGHVRERKYEITYELLDHNQWKGQAGVQRTKHILSDELCTDTAIISRYWPP